MIDVPNMLLIGAANRDAGKTTFACELISRFTCVSVQAAKVTVIQERNGMCPRGGEGCGVCASLQGAFLLTEEKDKAGEKDTQRMFSAGADRVFWLRVLRAELEAGVHALLKELGPETPVICESNSLRHAVRPGLFLMVRHTESSIVKTSAKQVQRHVDKTVYSNGNVFDFNFDHILFKENHWVLLEKPGGNSPPSRSVRE